jgi:hypothetical protein
MNVLTSAQVGKLKEMICLVLFVLTYTSLYEYDFPFLSGVVSFVAWEAAKHFKEVNNERTN